MLSTPFLRQLPFVILVIALFAAYGTYVRRGIIAGRNIYLVGAAVGVVAVAVWTYSTFALLLATAPFTPLGFVGPGLMVICAVYCVFAASQSQRSRELGTFQLGDTKIIVLSSPPTRFPDADALLLPTSTTLRMLGGVAGTIGLVAGKAVREGVLKLSPINLGKVVTTDGGKLAVGTIFHVAVQEPLRPVEENLLRRGMETAAQQARKAGAESVLVPVGLLRGLTVPSAATAMVEGTLKQRRSFAEIIFVALEPRDALTVLKAVREAVDDLMPGAAAKISKS